MYLFGVALLLFYLSSSNAVHQRVVRQSVFNSCQTPKNASGWCVPYQQCPQIAELLKVVPNPEKMAFLIQSKCGKREEQKVCCDESTITTPAPIDSTVLEYYSVCGKTTGTSSKIYEVDRNATIGDYPSMVALGYRTVNDQTKLWRCGGSLISDRWVITAAHCVNGIGLELTTARLGDVNLNENVDDKASPVDIDIERIVLHPQFVASPLQNDIALLRLNRPANFSVHIRPLCIPSLDLYKTDNYYESFTPSIVGWGHNEFSANEGAGGLKMLRDTNARVENRDNCTQRYKQASPNPIDIRSICVTEMENACHDSSGWPLIAPLPGKLSSKVGMYLVGVASFGGGCTPPSFPAVFTKVAYFSDWIKNVTEIMT